MKKIIRSLETFLAAAAFLACFFGNTCPAGAIADNSEGFGCYLVTETVNYSTSGTPSEKYLYTYDENGRTLEFEICDYDSGNEVFNGREKHTYTYDENGNVLMTRDYGWDDSAKAYVLSGVSENVYDAAGNRTSNQHFGYESDGETIRYGYKNVSTYDQYGNPLLYTGYEYDTGAEEFNSVTGRQKYEYEYDNGKVKSSIYSWFGVDWVKERHDVYTYDEAGFIKSETQSYYYGGVETNNYKREYVNDANGNPLDNIGYEWQESDWVKCERNVCAYDEQNHCTSSKAYRWKDSDWELTEEENTEYDKFGNRVFDEVYSLSGGKMVPVFKQEATFDALGRPLTDIYYDVDGDDYIPMNKSEYEHRPDGSFTCKYYFHNGMEWHETSSSESKVIALHGEAAKVTGQAPTDTKDGWKDAYQCGACGLYFEDRAEKTLIGDETAYTAWKTTGNGRIPAGTKVPGTGDANDLPGYALAFMAAGALLWFVAKKRNAGVQKEA